VRLGIAWHALRRGHRLYMRRVTIGLFDPSEGVLADCSCGKQWAL